MQRNHRILTVLLVVLVSTLACTIGSAPVTTPSPEPEVGVGTLDSIATTQAQMATRMASQDMMISYLATRVGAIYVPTPGPIPTRTPYNPRPTTTVERQIERYPSPEGSWEAWVLDGTQLWVSDPESGQRELFHSEKITGLSWFPDERVIAFSERIQDPSAQPPTVDRIWLIDVVTGDAVPVELGFSPLVSPDGRFMAFLSGVSYGDACYVGYRLAIMAFDESGVTDPVILQDQIGGFPEPSDDGSFYPTSMGGIAAPGVWLSSQELLTPMRWGCVQGSDEDGFYVVDAETLTATQVSGLEDLE